MRLDINEFYRLHGETIMFYKLMEHDLKIIYAMMLQGNYYDNLDVINKGKWTLGRVINELKKLDNSDGNSLISEEDYKFLDSIKNYRNYWAHENYLDFKYMQEWWNSKTYEAQCNRLISNHKTLEMVTNNLENIRVNYCKEIIECNDDKL